MFVYVGVPVNNYDSRSWKVLAACPRVQSLTRLSSRVCSLCLTIAKIGSRWVELRRVLVF
jgi:hypothetical protein